MQSFALPGVFSGVIGLVPVAFHLAGVPHSKNQWVDITHFLGLKFCNSNNPSHGSV